MLHLNTTLTGLRYKQSACWAESLLEITKG